MKSLLELRKYAYNGTLCRWRQLSRYFGEVEDGPSCAKCDVCTVRRQRPLEAITTTTTRSYHDDYYYYYLPVARVGIVARWLGLESKSVIIYWIQIGLGYDTDY